MVPSRVAGGMAQSPSSSGIFFQGDGQSQVAGNSHFSSDFGNSLNSFPGHTRGNIGPVSGDASNTLLNSMASSGPSVGASSLVTDANSGLSGGPRLQRSASINTESYMRLPASPLSFSSNNISISGSSAMDVSSVVQQSSANQDPGSQHAQQSLQYQGASSATSLPRMGHVQMPGGPRIPNSCIEDPTTLSHLHKKPRLDIKQDDVLQQLLSQRQDSMHMHSQNPQLQAMIQQQRLRQQEQQLLPAMPSMQRVQLLQQQHQQIQLRQQQQQLQLQAMPPAGAIKRPYDGGVCSRRLMQYLYHQRQRPAENAISYWKKFVKEYYSEHAKKRWCLSRYDNVGHQSLGVFPQSAMDAWHCDICGSKSGRGFEATVEVLPRLYEIKVGSGVIDDLLFLDLPRECRFSSGMLMLEYAKAVEESVYEQLRVVREGQLRILFAPDLKILSWEFCARRHEELLPRRLVAPQVNQILQVAHKCQTTISESGADGASQPDLQANSALVVTAGRQLAKSLELHSLNDLGFSKRYVRCLQIADVVNSMKDLMDFCREHKKGPIEGLKCFPRRTMPSRVQLQKIQEMEQMEGLRGIPTDCNTLNKLMTLQHPGLGGQMNSNQHIGGRGTFSGSAQAALALSNFQNFLMRQNSMNSIKQEASSPFNNSTQAPSTTTPEPTGALPGTLQNSAIGGFPNCQAAQQPQLQMHSSGLLQQRQPLPSQGSPALQQQMLQQLLQEMSKKSNNGPLSQHPHPIQNPSSVVSSSGIGFRNSLAATSSGTVPGIANGPPPNRSNNLKAAAASSNNGFPTPVGFSQKESDLPPSLHSMDEMVPDMSHEFIDGFFSNELDDNMNFSWKA